MSRPAQSPLPALVLARCLLVLGAIVCAAPGPRALAADSRAAIERNAAALLAQGREADAVAYVDSQFSASSPADRDLAVATVFTRVAVSFHGKRDRLRAVASARLAGARSDARMADATLTSAHYALCREQLVACGTILGDLARALARTECALRYIEQSGTPAELVPARDEFARHRARLRQKLNSLKNPN